MTFNLHPIFVHFPIALLLLYSVIRLAPLSRWFPKIMWGHIQIALLIPGVLGAFAASATGELAEHLVNANKQLIETHALFAGIATWVYVVLLLGELLPIVLPRITNWSKIPGIITRLLSQINNILSKPILYISLTSIGLLTISVAGLLGGVIVYGTSADPLAGFVLSILSISL